MGSEKHWVLPSDTEQKIPRFFAELEFVSSCTPNPFAGAYWGHPLRLFTSQKPPPPGGRQQPPFLDVCFQRESPLQKQSNLSTSFTWAPLRDHWAVLPERGLAPLKTRQGSNSCRWSRARSLPLCLCLPPVYFTVYQTQSACMPSPPVAMGETGELMLLWGSNI